MAHFNALGKSFMRVVPKRFGFSNMVYVVYVALSLSSINRRKFRSLTSDNIDNSSRAVQSER